MLFTRRLIHEQGLSYLTDKLHIKIAQHPEYPSLYHFHYSQFDSPFDDPVVRECRTLILDQDNDWAVVCMGYNKFFNVFEPLAADIDWKSARVECKVDGSLICCFWYDNKWNICTTGTADGGEFRDRFWTQWEKQELSLSNGWPDNECCFMFEYVSPETRVVVPYPEPFIYLHGVRSMKTLQEFYPGMRRFRDRFPLVEQFSIATLEDTLAAAKKLRATEQEGFVVVDKEFRRLKIKGPEYLKCHHLKGQMCERSLLDVARNNEDSEVLAYFPELKAEVDKYRIKLEYEAKHADLIFEGLSAKYKTRKEFALQAVKYLRISGCLFALLDGKFTSAMDWMRSLPIDSLRKVIE